ncbi:MAG: hypothetical protein K2M36_01950, partial [Clostridia bacterium]|nr:hypothetical protein [Clostridia bacterium]
MAYTSEGVQAFICALDDLQKSNVMYANFKLTRVLKCLAFYNEFRGVLASRNRCFDYEAEKNKA